MLALCLASVQTWRQAVIKQDGILGFLSTATTALVLPAGLQVVDVDSLFVDSLLLLIRLQHLKMQFNCLSIKAET